MSLDKKLRDRIIEVSGAHDLYEDGADRIIQVFIDEGWIEPRSLRKEAARVWLENERYKLFYGEIPEKYGEVDVMTAYKTYKDKEDFHQNFGRYVEALKTKLEESS